jgi:hypothetical protein
MFVRYVCSRLFVGIAVSNPTEGVAVCLLCLFVVASVRADRSSEHYCLMHGQRLLWGFLWLFLVTRAKRRVIAAIASFQIRSNSSFTDAL